MNKEKIAEDFRKIQDHICKELEQEDGKATFHEDLWSRPEGGGGRTRIIQDGNIIAKGGVAFSAVEGPTPKKILEKLQLDDADFFATGVSIVIHPKSPMVPIIHMNIRYFEMSNGVRWFGGGIDLTPHYVDEADARYFHQAVKDTCDQFDTSYYPKFKKWADDYFFIKHRNETRGIGGIFFDRLSADDEAEMIQIFEFAKAIGYLFPTVYRHFMKKNSVIAYGEKEKQWQALRRGRYVEFNLVWDAGTKFGLDTNGRTESILMSMPPIANWQYMHEPELNSREAHTLSLLKKGIDWV
ncbi:oxygen-dependent coproporphyrinogen oxidase [Belliella kenyensis]|uniref:coproporphyrinogen oxidase n=1 Tax=Belliella kenyensis TaxID=1472724 RepID=A0ABV8EJS2_9BACT|nr:oxygen-dependent coproporphyrinogen oxidase [Belliella kenyensis]MCH7403234.1 oxygen-dependent coproporphyrinogen oxidase [Belliella kenyensis]MDN3604845.1 oxygen-dependent coproporphyrinogen oxidase [Belliella kenyensis]